MGTVAAFKSEQGAEIVDDLRASAEVMLTVLESRMREIADEAVRAEEDLRSYSIETVIERLDATEYIVRRMIAQGKLETVKPTEGTIRITARSLRRFLYGDKVTGALASPSKEK